MDVHLVNGEPTTQPDTSAGHLLGLTCFETMAFEHGRILARSQHLARLAGSIEVLGLQPSGGLEAIETALEDALVRTEHASGIARVSLHATGRPTGLHVSDTSADVLVSLTAPRYGDLSSGVEAITSERRAPDPESWPAGVKAPCLPRWLAHQEARKESAFEALMTDAGGHVVSGTRSNVLVAADGALSTPPAPPAFPGITRARLLESAKGHGWEITVRAIDQASLSQADEVLLSFTGPGIVPVVQLDGTPVGDGHVGPLARELEAWLKARGETRSR